MSDVLFPKIPISDILEGHGMEDVGIFYDHLEYFTATWCILWQFGTVCGHLVYFSWFDILNSYM
jgi:hypothetical protein